MSSPTCRSFIAFAFIACSALFLGSGCATIVHHGERKITIATDPAGAKATLTKLGSTDVVTTGITPCTVMLDPKRGYFKGQSYLLKLELPGYKPSELVIQPKMSGWFLGNILFGGLIGILAVDPVTGAMWNLEPDKIEQKLTPEQLASIQKGDGFVVVLTSQLTANERSHLVKIQ